MGNQKRGDGQSKRDLAAGAGICVGIGDQCLDPTFILCWGVKICVIYFKLLVLFGVFDEVVVLEVIVYMDCPGVIHVKVQLKFDDDMPQHFLFLTGLSLAPGGH
jgi:hypothetical protein